MSYRIVFSSFAAIAIGMSCISDASAGDFAAPGFHSMPRMRGFAGGVGYRRQGIIGVGGPKAGVRYFAPAGVRPPRSITGVGGPGSGMGGVGGPTGGVAATATGVRASITPGIIGVVGASGGGAATATGVTPRIIGLGADGTAAGTPYYGTASYDSNAACGRYPYPPCKKPAKAEAKKKPAVEPDD